MTIEIKINKLGHLALLYTSTKYDSRITTIGNTFRDNRLLCYLIVTFSMVFLLFGNSNLPHLITILITIRVPTR